MTRRHGIPPIIRAGAAFILIVIVFAIVWAITHQAPPAMNVQLPTL